VVVAEAIAPVPGDEAVGVPVASVDGAANADVEIANANTVTSAVPRMRMIRNLPNTLMVPSRATLWSCAVGGVISLVTWKKRSPDELSICDFRTFVLPASCENLAEM